MTVSTPFMDFWKAINDQLAKDGYLDLRFGDARRLYQKTIEEARYEAEFSAVKHLQALTMNQQEGRTY